MSVSNGERIGQRPVDEWALVVKAQEEAIKNQQQKEVQMRSELKKMYRNQLDEQLYQKKMDQEAEKQSKDQERRQAETKERTLREWFVQKRKQDFDEQRTVSLVNQQQNQHKMQTTSFANLKILQEDKNRVQRAQDDLRAETLRATQTKLALKEEQLHMLRKKETEKMLEQVNTMRNKQKDQQMINANIDQSLKKEINYRENFKKRQDNIERKTLTYRKVASERSLKDMKQGEMIQNWLKEHDLRMQIKSNLEAQAKSQAVLQTIQENEHLISSQQRRKAEDRKVYEKQKAEMQEFGMKLAQEGRDQHFQKLNNQKSYKATLDLQSVRNTEKRMSEKKLTDIERRMNKQFSYVPGVTKDYTISENIFKKTVAEMRHPTQNKFNIRPSPSYEPSPNTLKHDPIVNPIGASSPLIGSPLGKGRGIALLNAGSNITRPANN